MQDFNLNDSSTPGEYDLRCAVTGNPCGTDTRPIGVPCLCANCVQWLAMNQTDLGPEFTKVLDENRWNLYESSDNSNSEDESDLC